MISELQGMLYGLLQRDPCLRMTLDELLLQSWVSQPISLAEYSWTEVVCAAHSSCKFTNQSVFLTLVVSLSQDCSFIRLTTVKGTCASSTYPRRFISSAA